LVVKLSVCSLNQIKKDETLVAEVINEYILLVMGSLYGLSLEKITLPGVALLSGKTPGLPGHGR
jgi:hypothetical protein